MVKVKINDFLDTLKKRCSDPISEFHKEGKVTNTANGVYIYKDNGSKILAVAHLDTTIQEFSWRLREKKGVVFCPQLDDRLGAFVILDILKHINIECDILLTEGEESGKSTAQFFKPPVGKDYNWIFSFDRRGTDVVMYKYEDIALKTKLSVAGFKTGIGSMSDICYMEDLGVKGFNIGVGYMNEHQQGCYAELANTVSQLVLFQKFYNTNKDIKLPHTKVLYRAPDYSYNGGNYRGYSRFGKSNVKDVFAFLECEPTVSIIIEDKEVRVSVRRLVHELSKEEFIDLFGEGFAEVALKEEFLRVLLKEAYGSDSILGVEKKTTVVVTEDEFQGAY